MAAAGETLDTTSLYNAMQEEYGKTLHFIQNNEAFGYSLIDQAQGFTFSGKRVVEAVTASYVASSGYYGQTPSSMPTPGSNTVSLTYIQQCVNLFNLRVDWTAIAKTTASAFVNAWSIAFDTLAEHKKLERERHFFGRGCGVLNKTTRDGAAGKGIDVVSGVAANWTFRVHLWDTPFFRVGMQIQFWSGTYDQTNWRLATMYDTPTQGFYTISAVVPDPTNKYCTVTVAEASTGSNSPADNALVTVAGAIKVGSTNTGNEPMGIQGIIAQDDAWIQHNVASDTLTVDTFQGIASTTNGFWRSPKITGSGTLTKDHLAALAVQQNVFGTSAASGFVGFLAHTAQEAKFVATLEGSERIMVQGGETPQVPSGRTSNLNREGMGPFIQYSGKPIMTSRMCYSPEVYGLNKRGVKKYVLQEPKFESRHQDFQGRPAWQMDGMAIDNVGTTDRSCCGLIAGLDVPSPT